MTLAKYKPLTLGVLAALAGVAGAQSQLSNAAGELPNPQVPGPQTGAPPTPSTPSDIVVTQSTSLVVTPFNSISCNSGAPGFLHTDNWYYRVFDVSGLGGDFLPQSLDLGIDEATGGADATQPVRIRIYDSADLADTLSDSNIVFESTVAVADQAASLLNIPVGGQISSGSMIVEVFSPDGMVDGESFFIGSNAAGQTGASFIRADACGIGAPTDLAGIGFANMHIVMSVNGKLLDPCPEDALSGNQTCATAAFITSGQVLPTLQAKQQSDAPDWFNIVVPPGHSVSFDLAFLHLNGNIDANLYQDCAGSLLSSATSTDDNESLLFTNPLPNTVSVFLEVFIPDGLVAECNAYDLAATVFDSCVLDDAFAGNDTCFGGELVAAGSYPGLAAFKEAVGADWFNVVVPPGETATLDVLFSHANGNVDVNLYQDCAGTLLDTGASLTDDEQVSFTNASAVTLSVFAEIFIEANDIEDCNTYELLVDVGPTIVGESYCTSVANSTGAAGTITGSGSRSVADDNLTLTASDVPNSFGIFYFGPNQIQVPFNNGGFQCVGGLIQRIQPPAVGSGNSAMKTVLPGNFSFSTGQVVNFQYWFRDQSVQPDQSNTTDAYSVEFVD